MVNNKIFFKVLTVFLFLTGFIWVVPFLACHIYGLAGYITDKNKKMTILGILFGVPSIVHGVHMIWRNINLLDDTMVL